MPRPQKPSRSWHQARPEDVVKEKRSYTGAFLKPVLARRTKRRHVEAAE